MNLTEINGQLLRAPLDTSPGWERRALPGQRDNTLATLSVTNTTPQAATAQTALYRKYLVVEAYSLQPFTVSVAVRNLVGWEIVAALTASLVGDTYQAHYETTEGACDGVRVQATGSSSQEQTVEVGIGTTRMEVF